MNQDVTRKSVLKTDKSQPKEAISVVFSPSTVVREEKKAGVFSQSTDMREEKKAPATGVDGSPPRMSIAELASKINPMALGGGNPMNNPNNPLVKKRLEAEAAMRSTMNGQD